MELPADIRRYFQHHGAAGGQARAARMDPSARRSVARRAATARWIRARFGASSFAELNLPGGEIVDAGLADLADGKATAASLAVSAAASRLRRAGVPLGTVHANPQDALFELLARDDAELANDRYAAYLRQMASFADACPSARIDAAR